MDDSSVIGPPVTAPDAHAIHQRLDRELETAADFASAEFRVRLGGLLRAARGAIGYHSECTSRMTASKYEQLGMNEQRIAAIADQLDDVIARGRWFGAGIAPLPEELERMAELRAAAQQRRIVLPTGALAERGISGVAGDVLFAIAAPYVEQSLGGLYRHLGESAPSPDTSRQVIRVLLATDPRSDQAVVAECGPFGQLATEQLIEIRRSNDRTTDVLVPGAGVVELMVGSSIDSGLLGEVPESRPSLELPSTVKPAVVARLAASLLRGEVDVVGVWGKPGSGAVAVGTMVAGQQQPVRVVIDCQRDVTSDLTQVATALQRAAIDDTVCLIEVQGDDVPTVATAIGELVARSRVQVIIVAEHPVRSARLWQRRRFTEVELERPSFVDHRLAWSAAFPAMDDAELDRLATRYRLLPDETLAVAALADSMHPQGSAQENGAQENDAGRDLQRLAAKVARRTSSRLALVRAPRRTREDLVLPEAEMEQVLDVAYSFQAWPRVAEDWRLDRMGNPGVTALFTGEPGTGKTLAAEVIANEIGLDLMIVDLSQLVSKWIGETEKNLDAVFTEAEASSCVLFFDEADTSFGSRGEVSRGSDRYANLEVGYMLQRLESYEGLVLLASNLRNNLDSAFTRRFHHIVHFPYPDKEQRRQLWELMLRPPVQITGEVDLDLLARLELTGAGIAAAVRTAALRVHAQHRSALAMSDIEDAVRSQFRREARLLPRGVLLSDQL